jgi:hypothetical protein
MKISDHTLSQKAIVIKPILFSDAMVRAILDDQKTQTRRALKPQPVPFMVGPKNAQTECEVALEFMDGEAHPRVRLGRVITEQKVRWAPGDHLWVREAWSPEHKWSDTKPREIPNGDDIWYWADGNPPDGDWTKPKPSIFMPRWASRITLEVTAVRVERLQSITETDATAEGILATEFWRDNHPPSICYSVLWNAINGAGSWDTNPWVVVIEFRRVTP